MSLVFLSSCAMDMATKSSVLSSQNSRLLLYIYLDAKPSSNFDLNITSAFLVNSYGTEVPLVTELVSTSSDDLKSKQVLVAGVIIPSGSYSKLLLEVNKSKVEIPIQINLKNGLTEVINLKWQLDKQEDDVPLFKSEIGLFDLVVDNTMLVSHVDSDYISIIDTSTMKVVDAVTVCDGPSAMDYNSKRNEIIVACKWSNEVAVIDFNTLNIVNKVFLSSCSSPNDIIYIEDENEGGFGKAYLLCEDSDSISVMDTITWKDSSERIEVGLKPVRFTYNSTRKELYVVNNASNDVSIVNTSVNKFSQSVLVGSRPIDIVYDEKSDKVYVLNNFSNFLSILSVDIRDVIQKGLSPLNPVRMFFSDSEVFLLAKDNILYFYDHNFTSMNELKMDSYSNAFGYKDSFKHLYVGEDGLRRIKVVDVLQRQTIKTIDLMENPYEVLILEY